MNHAWRTSMNKKVKTVGTLIGMAAITVHILNRIQYSISTVKNTLGCSENNYYEWRFGKIRYTKRGNGTPLLLIHDLALGSSNYEYHNLIDVLSKKYEVYSLDLLGYGLSDKPNMTYTNYLYVQLLTDFIKNIIGRKTDVVASGDSAPLAVMTCHNNPEIMNRLVLINPQSLFQLNQRPSKQTKALKLLIETPIIGTFVYNILTTRSAFANAFQNKYYANSSKIKEEDIMAYVEASHLTDYNSKYSFASYIGRYTNSNIIHALKEINHSIFIIAGEEKADIDTITENYLYYNNSIEVAKIPNTKQYPHMESPNKVLQQLSIFLD